MCWWWIISIEISSEKDTKDGEIHGISIEVNSQTCSELDNVLTVSGNEGYFAIEPNVWRSPSLLSFIVIWNQWQWYFKVTSDAKG